MMVGWQLGNGPGSDPQRISYHDISTKLIPIIGASANFADINYIGMDAGRFFSPFEEDHRRNVIVLGYTVGETLFPAVDPLGKKVRLNQEEFTVVGVMGKRPSPLGGDPNAFAVIPSTTYDKIFEVPRIRGILMRFLFVGVVGYPNVPREQLLSQVQEVMRSRHRLKVDQENDFDIVTSDMIMGIFDQFTRAIFLALVVISSIALMVGGIGVMAIMTISVTERTREIGIRKALGARRREILWQFLLEAVFLTSIGGLLGILLRQQHRPARPPAGGLPGLAAVVVVRHRHRLFGERRHLLRPLARLQSVAARSNRSAQIRIDDRAWCSVPGAGAVPVPGARCSLRPAALCLRLTLSTILRSPRHPGTKHRTKHQAPGTRHPLPCYPHGNDYVFF